MTAKECYDAIGGNFEEVCERMMGREALVAKFAKKFLDDTSYQELKQHLKEGNVELAFRAAHTLKGVTQNLALTALAKPSVELTEVLRTGTLEGTEELFEQVTEAYEKTVEGISQL
jgi:HPt (histidine-containing phosphotransfer) domain-containing protein